MEEKITIEEKFNLSIQKLARSDLRLQLFQKNNYSMDIEPLLKLEEDYNLKLKEQALFFRGKIVNAVEVAKKIFEMETLRRIRIEERDINFHCPDCIYLFEEEDNFICRKGIDPSKVQECKYFKREDMSGWTNYVNNKKARLKVLREIFEKKEHLFDFTLLD